MRSAWAAGFAWVVVSVLAASCTGAGFSEGGAEGAEAGADAGGAPPSSGGSRTMAGETNEAGAALAGTSQGGSAQGGSGQGGAGMVVGDSGAGGTGEPPAECDVSSKVDQPGDCKQWACVAGQPKSVVDLKDLPEAKGECYVASCKVTGPAYTDDSSRCSYNEKCSSGSCVCRGCPNGALENVVAGTCRMPMGVTATATHTGVGFSPNGAIDGDTKVTWNSGMNGGQLTLTFASPQPMTGLVIYVTGSADASSMGSRTINLSAKVDDADGGNQIVKNGSWDYSMTSTGPIQLALGRAVRTNKIVMDFTSAASWVAVNEALFVICDP